MKTSQSSWFQGLRLVTIGLALLLMRTTYGQVPALLWRTNVNATLFGIDSQTNVYANANGTVITLNSLGVPFQTNSICPVPSIAPSFALRDPNGNYYFAGNFDGTNDFGGKIIVGGWTNLTPTPGKWEPGYPTCYLAKYSSTAALLWATRIDGLIAGSNVVSDLVLNSDGSVTIGNYAGLNFAQISQFNSTGTRLWQTNIANFPSSGGPIRLSSLRGTNGGYLLFKNATGNIGTGHYTSSGSAPFNSSQPLQFTPTTNPSGKPVTTPAGEIYTAGFAQFGPAAFVLQKAVIGGGILWTQVVSINVEHWVLNGDHKGNVYLSGTDGSFYDYDSAGTQIWTNNYDSPAVVALSDLPGNRFVQFADGSIALISADPGAQWPRVHFNPLAGDGSTPAGFQFSLSGEPGSFYEILWSTNLTSWQSMGYVSNNTSEIEIVDSDAINRSWKFYEVAP
jgi:hypothetical protein